MEWLKVLWLAPLSYVALFLITKLIGYRQLSQMSIFDYVNGITIGSIAAEMATELEQPLRPLLAMVLYCLLVVGTSLLTSRWLPLRRWMAGRPLILLENGTLYRENLKKSKMDVNEFLAQCRDHGYFDLQDIQLALLENSGKVSFLPKTSQRPTTPTDMGVTVSQALPQVNLVVDGELLADNLQFLGFDETWLDRQLATQKTKTADCLLVTANRDGIVRVFPKESKPMTRDMYM